MPGAENSYPKPQAAFSGHKGGSWCKESGHSWVDEEWTAKDFPPRSAAQPSASLKVCFPLFLIKISGKFIKIPLTFIKFPLFAYLLSHILGHFEF